MRICVSELSLSLKPRKSTKKTRESRQHVKKITVRRRMLRKPGRFLYFCTDRIAPPAVRTADASGRRMRGSTVAATHTTNKKHTRNYGRFHLSGALSRRRGQNRIPPSDEGLREGRRMRRTQDAQGRSRGSRAAVEGRLRRRVVLPARFAPAETARHPRRFRSHRQRQVRGLHHAAQSGGVGRGRAAHVSGYRHGHLHRP